MSSLVLSLFPGLGLLDMAFEAEGFCVVRGPDVLWGGDIRGFYPPSGAFQGLIGGPPCQTFSVLAHLVRARGRETRFGNLIPEFERCVLEAQPDWFIMENVPQAPAAQVEGYEVQEIILNNRWVVEGDDGIGAAQRRKRRFCFGSRAGLRIQVEYAALESPLVYLASCDGSPGPNSRAVKRPSMILSNGQRVPVAIGGGGKRKATAPPAVTSSDGSGAVRQVRYTLAEACQLQGLPADFLADAPFTAAGKLKAVANGVPLYTGRAIAQAIRRALEPTP